MKKILSALMMSVLLISLMTACRNNGNDDNDNNNNNNGANTSTISSTVSGTGYKDGNYSAEFKDFDDHGWKATVSLTVKDGKVTEAKFDAVDEDGNKKSEDEAYKTRWLEQMPEADMYPEKAFNEIARAYIEKQDSAAFDNIEGATGASDDAKALISSLQSRMRTGDTTKLIVDNPVVSE